MKESYAESLLGRYKLKPRGILGLGIESSCDETSAAIIEDGYHVHSLLIDSQLAIHAPFQGVVPELASRSHLVKINEIIASALDKACLTWRQLDYVAVTHRPGLIGSLIIGVQAAKAISLATGLPLIGINHLAAHLHAPFVRYGSYQGQPFPERNFLALLISGGNCALIAYQNTANLALLANTLDDAPGEAFDKVAKMLNLGYPGGPIIEKLALMSRFASQDLSGKELEETLPLPMILADTTHDDLRFSFSGIKTAIYRIVCQHQEELTAFANWHNQQDLITKNCLKINQGLYSVADLLYAFQYRVSQLLTRNVRRLLSLKTYKKNKNLAPLFVLSGGVAANGYICEQLRQTVGHFDLDLAVASKILCTDNAAMVAAAGYHAYQGGIRHGLDLDVDSRPIWADTKIVI